MFTNDTEYDITADIVDEITGGTPDVDGGVETYQNHRGEINKDDTISALIPEQVSECAMYLGRKPGEPCSSPGVINAIKDAAGVTGNNSTEIMQSAKSRLGCETESCVLQKLEDAIGSDVVKREMRITMKLRGPTDTKLLSNYNCDATLIQWATKFTDFFPYNFNMRDYAQRSFVNGDIINQPDTLATITWGSLYRGELAGHNGHKYRCCGCIINSDVYSGQGKHWMALFADARGRQRWTVEFFNSSGNAPAPEWISWLVKIRDQMKDLIDSGATAVKPVVEIVRACKIRHQQSRTECGVYSLFYVWARLNGIPPEYFLDHPIPDQLMMEFRQHLFTNDQEKNIGIGPDGKFRFEAFKQHARVEWE